MFKLRTAVGAIGLILVCATPSAAAEGQPMRFEHVMSFGSEGVGPGEFKYAEDVVLLGDDQVIVTDAAHAFIQVFDRRTGNFVARFGGKGYEDRHLDKPEGVAVAPDGHIFIADYNTGFIKKYDPALRWVATFSGYGSGLGETMMAELMDIRHGRLYVPDIGNHRVNVFSLEGEPLFHFGGKGSEAGRFNAPEAAKFNGSGHLHVVDHRNDRIQVFDKDGAFLFAFGSSGDRPGELSAPVSIAFDRYDNVYVTELGNNRVQVFDRTGKHLAMWGKHGSGPDELDEPYGISIDQNSGWIYIADSENNRIQVFRRAGPQAADQPTQ